MLTLKQCKDNAYAIATIMMKCKTFKRAVSCINNVCDLNVNEDDLRLLVKLRINYYRFDAMFLIYE